jgi:hypothetical protein
MMTEKEQSTAIVPAEQRAIDFYGDELIAVRDADGTVWVPIRPLCEALGVSRRGQMERIERDPILSEAAGGRRVTRPPEQGGPQDMACLPLKYVRAWLFGINANRVKPEIRDKLLAYQRDIIEIIDRAFAPPQPPQDLDDEVILALRDNALQQAKIWDAIHAERKRLRATEQYIEEMDEIVGDHERAIRRHDQALNEIRTLQREQGEALARLTDSIRLLPAPQSGQISPDQKAAIKALVDDIVAAALARGVRLGQGRNDYPAVWDAFKRRFDLAKYDELPSEKFDEALAWLKAWLERVQTTTIKREPTE